MSLLRRLSMGDSVLVAEKHSVTTELLTQDENTACLDAYRPLAPVEGRARVKRASLIPLSIAVASIQAHGRTPSTIALLKALGETPLLWSKLEEQEANRKEYEIDLVLDDEIREMEGECDVHMSVELESMVSFQKVAVDEEKAESWTLKSIPISLERELASYKAYRSAPLNRHRDGGEIMEITIAGDRSCALRLLGFLQTTKGVRPALSVFGDADMGAFAEAYMNACKEKGLRWSSLANYVNSFVSLTRYVHSTMDEPPSETLDELIRLRSQAESQAKVERLFTPRDKNWIDWEDAQKARVAAETAYRSAKGSAKLKVLKEWTLISCFTVMPPDRVGIVRLLRLGGSLKKEKDGFVLDLTATKLHKTSRFHGPSITTISPLLNEQLSAMCTQLTFDNVEEGKQPYLWHVASDATRPVASSAFTKMVKDAFLKYGGKATPPKVLRASELFSSEPHLSFCS
jgi:hypothetical protein